MTFKFFVALSHFLVPVVHRHGSLQAFYAQLLLQHHVSEAVYISMYALVYSWIVERNDIMLVVNKVQNLAMIIDTLNLCYDVL